MPDGPCYVVIGATGGIGTALCRRLADAGARLVVAGRSEDRLRELAGTLDARAFPLDATDLERVHSCLAEAEQVHGRVDGVANCAGSLLLKPAHLTTGPEWEVALAANLTTAFACVRAGARVMRPNGGAIVLVSSAAARLGLPNHEAIAAAKAGVIGLTLAAAASYAGQGIRVNCVAPGLVRTPLTARLIDNETALKASTALHALGRIGEPGEVAEAIAWLLDPRQSWITGQVLGIDGGLATVRTRGQSP
jgi:NAD(P)-dependent dehydrogenase (short-subunit alcohol dehydrogenase family)